MKWNYSIKTFIAIYLQSDGDASISSLNDWNYECVDTKNVNIISLHRSYGIIICSIFAYCSQKKHKNEWQNIFNKSLSLLLVYGTNMYDKIGFK